MAAPRSHTPPAQLWELGSGATSAVATLPLGADPETLVVIDHIMAKGVINAAGTGTLTMGTVGGIVQEQTIAAAGSFSFNIDFSGGFPCWDLENNDTTVDATAPTVTVAGSTSAAVVVVTYHYENPSYRRR